MPHGWGVVVIIVVMVVLFQVAFVAGRTARRSDQGHTRRRRH